MLPQPYFFFFLMCTSHVFRCVPVMQDNPRAVLKAGGAKACLAFFDFFPLDLQQNALGTVSRLVAPGVCGRRSDIRRAREVRPDWLVD